MKGQAVTTDCLRELGLLLGVRGEIPKNCKLETNKNKDFFTYNVKQDIPKFYKKNDITFHKKIFKIYSLADI